MSRAFNTKQVRRGPFYVFEISGKFPNIRAIPTEAELRRYIAGFAQGWPELVAQVYPQLMMGQDEKVSLDSLVSQYLDARNFQDERSGSDEDRIVGIVEGGRVFSPEDQLETAERQQTNWNRQQEANLQQQQYGQYLQAYQNNEEQARRKTLGQAYARRAANARARPSWE